MFNWSKKEGKDKKKHRYTQAPHLTQDTNGKVITSQLDITNESQDGRFCSQFMAFSQFLDW